MICAKRNNPTSLPKRIKIDTVSFYGGRDKQKETNAYKKFMKTQPKVKKFKSYPVWKYI